MPEANNANQQKKPNKQDPQGGLQDTPKGATIPPANDNPKGAGDSPEDTLGKYQETIAAQQKQIGTLLEQVNSLNEQIVSYVRSTGAKAEEGKNPDDAGEKPAIGEGYVYLKDLGKEIGKRER